MAKGPQARALQQEAIQGFQSDSALQPRPWSALGVKSDSWASQESESVFFEDRLVPCFPEEGGLGSKTPFPNLSGSHRQGVYTDLCPRTKKFGFCGAQGTF